MASEGPLLASLGICSPRCSCNFVGNTCNISWNFALGAFRCVSADLIPFARNAPGVQGLRASRRARLDCPARDNRMPMQVPAGAEGARAAEGRAASGRCGRRPQHRCERADARDLERAAREHRMRSRCAAGAEGARAAEGRVAPPPPASTSPKKLLGTPQWGFQPAVAPPFHKAMAAGRPVRATW